LRHFLQRTAVTPWRVVIVDSADDLNPNSANALLKSLEAAGATARDKGFECAREMLAWSRTEMAGAYIIPPFKRYEEVLDIL